MSKHRKSSTAAVALAAIIALGAAGCGADKDSPAPNADSTQSSAQPSSEGNRNDPPPVDADTAHAPQWEAADKAAAKTFASKVINTFAHTDKPKKQWLDDLAPYMTQESIMEWQDANPSRFPIKAPITAEPRLKTNDTNPYIATVQFPIRGTTWIVALVRGDHNEWKATEIGPEHSPIHHR